jgi:hypothetical protein
VEEQNIRRSLGPALFERFCDAVQAECEHLNSVAANRMIVTRTPLSISVKDAKTVQSMELTYQDLAPCISYQKSGRLVDNITFRVEKGTAPTLTLVYSGVPHRVEELATSLIVGLARPSF